MLAEVFGNVEFWISGGIAKEYKRRKQYGYEFAPLKIEKPDLTNNRMIMEQMRKTII